jgi:hypothetical protein
MRLLNYNMIINQKGHLPDALVPVFHLDFLSLYLSGRSVELGGFRFSYNTPPKKKTPGATSRSFDKKNFRILSIIFILA